MPPGFWCSFLGVELPKSSEETAHPNKLGTAGLVRASIHRSIHFRSYELYAPFHSTTFTQNNVMHINWRYPYPGIDLAPDLSAYSTASCIWRINLTAGGWLIHHMFFWRAIVSLQFEYRALHSYHWYSSASKHLPWGIAWWFLSILELISYMK
jgi:hypothetical protein